MMKRLLLTMAIVFALMNLVIFFLTHSIPAYNFAVLESGNVIMFVLSAGTCMLVSNQTGKGKSTAAFIRGVSGATFIKLMVCLISMLAYVMMNRDTLYKPTIFVLMGIYGVYTTVETILLSKLARTAK